MKLIQVVFNSEESVTLFMGELWAQVLEEENIIERFKQTKEYRSDDWDQDTFLSFLNNSMPKEGYYIIDAPEKVFYF